MDKELLEIGFNRTPSQVRAALKPTQVAEAA